MKAFEENDILVIKKADSLFGGKMPESSSVYSMPGKRRQ